MIACGENFSLCCTKSGKLYSWGSNELGQLGLKVFPGVSTPREIMCDLKVRVDCIRAGRYHACFLSNSKAYSWGFGAYGQLGYTLDPQLGANVPTSVPSISRCMCFQQYPRLISGPWQKVLSIECGAYQTYIKAIGEVLEESEPRRVHKDDVLWPTKDQAKQDPSSAWETVDLGARAAFSTMTHLVSSVTDLFSSPERRSARSRSPATLNLDNVGQVDYSTNSHLFL